MAVLLEDMDLQLAEAAAERHLLRFVDLLAREDQQHMAVKRVAELFERCLAERLGQVDAANLGAHHARNGLNIHGYPV